MITNKRLHTVIFVLLLLALTFLIIRKIEIINDVKNDKKINNRGRKLSREYSVNKSNKNRVKDKKKDSYKSKRTYSIDENEIVFYIEEITTDKDLKSFIIEKINKFVEYYKERYGEVTDRLFGSYYSGDTMFIRIITELQAVIMSSQETFFCFLDVIEEKNDDDVFSLLMQYLYTGKLSKVKIIDKEKNKWDYKKYMWPNNQSIFGFNYTPFNQKGMSFLIDKLLNSKNEKLKYIISQALTQKYIGSSLPIKTQSYGDNELLISEESMKKLIGFIESNIYPPEKLNETMTGTVHYIRSLLDFIGRNFIDEYDFLQNFLIDIMVNKNFPDFIRHDLISSFVNPLTLSNEKNREVLKKIIREWNDEPYLQSKSIKYYIKNYPEEIYEDTVNLYERTNDNDLKKKIVVYIAAADYKSAFEFVKKIILSESESMSIKAEILETISFELFSNDKYQVTRSDYEKLLNEIIEMKGKVSDELRCLAYYTLFHFHYPVNMKCQIDKDANWKGDELVWSYKTLNKMMNEDSEFIKDVAKDLDELIQFRLPGNEGKKTLRWSSPYGKFYE